MHKEILLIRKIFIEHKFCKTEYTESSNPVMHKEKLLAAYDKLLLNLLPDIARPNTVNNRLCICQMTKNLLLLELQFGEINLAQEPKCSIDPYSFMSVQIFC